MFLFNKAISAYGNLLMKETGVVGLLDYAKKVINKIAAAFENKIYYGFRYSEQPYAGNNGNY